MTEDSSTDDSTGVPSTEQLSPQATVSSTYKVLGEFDADNGAGVLGNNTASNGTPIGVEGAVPNNGAGYGLSTPDDARIEGDIESTSGHTLTVDGTPTLELGPEGDDGSGTIGGGNVVGGFKNNDVQLGVVGATVGGGGNSSTSTVDGVSRDNTNEVTGHYGTVGGGYGNRATRRATIAGGGANTARGTDATIGGGLLNTADDIATVGGGSSNDATNFRATVAGGLSNTASGEQATVGGGYGNEARAKSATIAGGGDFDSNAPRNIVHDNYGTIGGGDGNVAGASGSTTATFGTVAGGKNNTANASFATVGGGNANRATNTAATVPGGELNTAGGQYSLAAGRRAKADFDGNFVWADSTDSDFQSSAADQFLVQAGGGAGIGTTTPSTQLDVDGAVTASDGYRGNVGSAAYLSSNQTVSGSSTETIKFNNTEADQRNEFDTNNGEYICEYAGDYAVDVGINMSGGTNAISSGDEVHVNIAVNGIPKAEKVYTAPQSVVDPTITVSRTVFGLDANDVITAELNNTTSNDLDVYGGDSKWTWMTVRQVA